MLSEKYQGEQRELDAKIERLHEAMEAAAQTAVDAEKYRSDETVCQSHRIDG